MQLEIVERNRKVSEVDGTIFGSTFFYGSRRSQAWHEFKKACDALAKKYGGVWSSISTRKSLWEVTYYFEPPFDMGYPAFRAEAKKLSAKYPVPEGIDIYAFDKELDDPDIDDENDEDESGEDDESD
jgi:hypothetical protein